MKKCTIGLLTKLIAFLVMIGFFLPLTLLFLWLFLHDTQAAPSLQQTYLLGVLLFGSFLLFAAYRMLYLGLIWKRLFSITPAQRNMLSVGRISPGKRFRLASTGADIFSASKGILRTDRFR